MYHFKDSGFGNVWLQDGYKTGTDKFGSYLSIDDIPGLYGAIAIALAHGGGSLGPAELRLMRQQLGMTQKQLGEGIGRTEQTILLWERCISKENARSPSVPNDSARLIKLMLLEKLCKEMTLSAAFSHLEQATQYRIVMTRKNSKWDSAINGIDPVAVHLKSQNWYTQEDPYVSFESGHEVTEISRAHEITVSSIGGPQWTH